MSEVDPEQWRKEQLEKFEENPGEALEAIKQVLGDELFEKVAQRPQQQTQQPQFEPQVGPDGITVLDAIDKIQNRIPKAVEKGIEPLSSIPIEGFTDSVKTHVQKMIDQLPATEKVQLTEADVMGFTRLVAGLAALDYLGQAKGEEKAEEPQETEKPEVTVPDILKGDASTIDAMKDALLANGFTEDEIRAMYK